MTRMPFADSSIAVVRSPVWSWMRAHDLVVLALEAPAEHQDRDRGRHGQQRERHVQEEEEHEDRDHLDHDDQQEDRAERGEPADHRDVGARPREQLPRLPAVVEADLEPLQVLVEVVAQPRLDVGGDDREIDAPAVGEAETSTSASPTASAKSGNRPDLSPSVIGPSIAAFTTSGIASWQPIETIAVTAMKTTLARCGRRYGRTRQSARCRTDPPGATNRSEHSGGKSRL